MVRAAEAKAARNEEMFAVKRCCCSNAWYCSFVLLPWPCHTNKYAIVGLRVEMRARGYLSKCADTVLKKYW